MCLNIHNLEQIIHAVRGEIPPPRYSDHVVSHYKLHLLNIAAGKGDANLTLLACEFPLLSYTIIMHHISYQTNRVV